MFTITRIKIFIASSSELDEERKESLMVAAELENKYPHLHLKIELFELATSSGNNPDLKRIQDKINPLLDGSEIVVVLFYSKIGEFTKEEFDRARKQNKKIFLYLKNGYQPSNADASERYTQVLKLKESVEKESEIRYQKFNTLSDYHGMLYIDLDKYLTENHLTSRSLIIDNATPITILSKGKLKLYPKSRPYFTGREAELDAFKKALDARNAFIAVDGPGGIGKTQFVSKCIESFISHEKVLWFQCTSASQFDTLISEAGYPDLLKGSSKTDREKFSAFKDKIEENEFYLFLDDFQETNSNPVFKEFLKFIQEYLKKGCVIVIDRDDLRSIELAPKSIKIEGFKDKKLEYAKAVIYHRYSDLKISDHELDDICEKLQGYPLAIDFAILLLSKGITGPDIVKTIAQDNHVSKISETLLNAIFTRTDATQEEKDFIRQFSVFTGVVSEEAVLAIMSKDAIQIAQRNLQEKNLLSYYNHSYEIHPLVREFCYKELEDKEIVHSKVAEFYVGKRTNELSPSLEEQIFYHLASSKQWERIEEEIERKGTQFILLGQLGLVKELLEKLKNIGIVKPIFNIFYGDIEQIQGKWDSAQMYFNNARLNDEDKRVKAEGMLKYGEMLYRKNSKKEAFELFENAYDFSDSNDFLVEKARALNDIGLIYNWNGDLDKAYEKFNESLNLRLNINDRLGLGISYFNIAILLESRGELDEALRIINESLSIRKEIGDQSGIAESLLFRGRIFQVKGKLDDAMTNFKQGLAIVQSIGNKSTIASCFVHLGGIYQLKGRLSEAMSLYKESLDISMSVGDTSGVADSTGNIADLHLKEKKYIEADRKYNEVLDIYVEIQNKSGIATTLNNISNSLREQGRFEDAVTKLQESIKLYTEIGFRLGIATSCVNIGDLYAMSQPPKYELALENLFKAYSLYGKMEVKRQQNECLNVILKIRDQDLGLNNFKVLAEDCFQSLPAEMQEFIPLNEIIKEPHRADLKIGRNVPCPCGSGKKYKNCHGAN